MINKTIGGQIISLFIPSAIFAGFLLFILGPIIPFALSDVSPLIDFPVILFILSLTVSFVLSSLNIFLLKVLEGYILLEHIPIFRKRLQNKAIKIRRKINELQAEIVKNYEIGEELSNGSIEEIQNQLYQLTAFYQLNFPPDVHTILSTRFGNILRAAESYPLHRYGMDSVTLWPRLVHVIPDSYYQKIEQSNYRVAFMVNCVFLSFLSTLFCLLASLFQYALWKLSSGELLYFLPVNVSFSARDTYSERAWLYLILSLVVLAFCIFSYNAALPVVRTYGTMIRGAFDLFRFDLLQQLNVELPQDSDEEFDLWQKISESFAVGDALGPLVFHYHSNSEYKSFDEFVEIKPYIKVDDLAPTTIMPVQLLQILVAYFSESELRDLCFHSNIDFESLPGSGKSAKARELIAYFQRRSKYLELVEKCKTLRPRAPWG